MAHMFSVILFLFLLVTGLSLTAGKTKSKIEDDVVTTPSKRSANRNAQHIIEMRDKVDLFQKAVQGSAHTQFFLRYYYASDGGVTKEVVNLFEWAEKGNANAQYLVGHCYSYISGYKEAVKWFREAADQGHSDAQFRLAHCYSAGSGVPQNKIEAVKWYRKAAKKSHPDAILFLETSAPLMDW